MTEKRYDVIDKLEPRGQSVTEGGIPCTARTCVTRLNRLTEENEQLKKENKHLRCTIESNSQDDYIDFLEKENERLRNELELYKHYITFTAIDDGG